MSVSASGSVGGNGRWGVGGSRGRECRVECGVERGEEGGKGWQDRPTIRFTHTRTNDDHLPYPSHIHLEKKTSPVSICQRINAIRSPANDAAPPMVGEELRAAGSLTGSGTASPCPPRPSRVWSFRRGEISSLTPMLRRVTIVEMRHSSSVSAGRD